MKGKYCIDLTQDDFVEKNTMGLHRDLLEVYDRDRNRIQNLIGTITGYT